MRWRDGHETEMDDSGNNHTTHPLDRFNSLIQLAISLGAFLSLITNS